jgi:hypothetical protein
MDRKTALIELRDKVKAGGSIWPAELDGTELADRPFGDAYNGSLDAAKALHESVLPGWVVYEMGWWPCIPVRLNQPKARFTLWQTHVDSQGERWHGSGDKRASGECDTPARAWLLAIIEALIAEEPVA